MHFLENVGFLIVNKYKPHKYSDIRIVVYKKAATGVTALRDDVLYFFIQQCRPLLDVEWLALFGLYL